jgi:hypothetical protein
VRQSLVTMLAFVVLFGPAPADGNQPPAGSSISMASRAPADPDDAVMLLMVPDLSGSMAKPVAALREAEVAQLTRSLRPGDVYARIPFTVTARVTVLQRVSLATDIDLIGRVVDQETRAEGRTALSSGLSAARKLVEEFSGGRRVILVLITDGIQAPADSIAAETRRMDEVAAWWRELPRAQRLLVGVPARSNATVLAKLAESLDAELIAPDAFAKDTIVERAIAASREISVHERPSSLPHVAVYEPLGVIPGALAIASLTLLWIYIRRRRATRSVTEVPPVVRLSAPKPPAPDVVVKVVSGGRAEQRVIDMEAMDGSFTLGTAGTVFVPGMPGSPVTVELPDGEISLAVAPGAGISVNGEPADALSQPMRMGSTCRLSAADGTTMVLAIKGATSAAVPPRLRALRARRVH